MRTFKLVDCCGQLLLIVVGLMMGIGGGLDETSFFAAYFVVGGWQVLSAILHGIFYSPTHKSKLRRIYLITLGVVAGCLLMSLSGFVLEALYGLLFFSPVMAVYYLITCMLETKRLSEAAEVAPEA